MAYSGVHTDIVGVSAFITCGLHDEVTVSCSHTLAKGIPHNEFLIFGNGSHTSGQSCIAANRILARGIHDAFVEGLTEMMGLIDDRALASMARAGYVLTENLYRALNVADRLQTGLVGINQGVPPMRRPRSAASSSQGWVGKAAAKDSTSARRSGSTTSPDAPPPEHTCAPDDDSAASRGAGHSMAACTVTTVNIGTRSYWRFISAPGGATDKAQ
jgi:hypothetical protein